MKYRRPTTPRAGEALRICKTYTGLGAKELSKHPAGQTHDAGACLSGPDKAMRHVTAGGTCIDHSISSIEHISRHTGNVYLMDEYMC